MIKTKRAVTVILSFVLLLAAFPFTYSSAALTNLFDKSKVTVGFYDAQGNYSDNDYFMISDFISVSVQQLNKRYRYCCKNERYLCSRYHRSELLDYVL